MWQEYLFADDVEGAVSILNSSKGQARIIAGGTDVILDIESGRHQCGKLVDLSRIKSLCRIEEKDGMIHIGANVTCAQVATSALVKEKAPALAQGARKLGSPQIRNIATIAGNVVRAQPAADTAVPLIALGASVHIVDINGAREIDILDAYKGVAASTIDSTAEVLTHFTIPVQKPEEGSAYFRLDKRKALSLPILNMACRLSLAGDIITDATIAVGPVGPGPQRAYDLERQLKNASVSKDSISSAAKLVLNNCDPRDSAVRGSRKYRLAVLPTIAERVIYQAVVCAGALPIND